MNQRIEMAATDRIIQAESIVEGLPEPNYAENYQPTYPEPGPLIEAVAENLSTTGVATFQQVKDLTSRLEAVSDPDDSSVLVITGGCRETIHVDTPVMQLAEESARGLAIAGSSKLREVVQVERGRGQYKKPRSAFEEQDEQGNIVPVYMGDVINGMDFSDRTPDPSRLVAGAVQARDREAGLTRLVGRHMPAAHEALSLAYELPFVRQDPDTGKAVSVSGDLLWAGLRTNQLGSDVIKLLMTLGNTTGVKIDGTSDEAHIAGLEERLNPDNRPGKSIYMLRLGLHEADRYPTILEAIHRHAPRAITLFDIHGSTEKVRIGDQTVKIRHVPSIIEGMGVMAEACQAAGVKFGGVHLETTPDHSRLECTDKAGQLPLHEGDLDPRLNPRQTKQVLDALADINNAQYA